MRKAKFIVGLLLISIIVGTVGVLGYTYHELFQVSAPQCPSGPSAGRSISEISAALARGETVTISDAEATSIAIAYAPAVFRDLRVCFDAGVAHVSGTRTVGLMVRRTFSFYVTGNAALPGGPIQVSVSDVVLGGIRLASSPAKPVADGIVNTLVGAVASVSTKDSFDIQFAPGVLTIRRESP